jgi:hypothetical protein
MNHRRTLTCAPSRDSSDVTRMAIAGGPGLCVPPSIVTGVGARDAAGPPCNPHLGLASLVRRRTGNTANRWEVMGAGNRYGVLVLLSLQGFRAGRFQAHNPPVAGSSPAGPTAPLRGAVPDSTLADTMSSPVARRLGRATSGGGGPARGTRVGSEGATEPPNNKVL